MTIEQKPAGTFARVSAPTPSWMEQNKTLVLRLSTAGAAILLAAIAGSIWISNQSEKAQELFNGAMQVYDAPIRQPGMPAMPGTTIYASAADRSKAANPLFQQVVDRFGSYKAGQNARYFAGLTAEDAGNSAAAEADLKKAADSGDSGLRALAKMALASLYVQSGRQPQAASIYNDLIAHPTQTVPANAARLALAGSEETTNPQAARLLYAKIKDSDKSGAAGQIATAKLSGH